MASFAYKALQRDGAVVEGQLTCGSRQEALRKLDALGLQPVSVKAGAEETEGRAHLPKLFGGERVPRRALRDFTHLLANLLAAGVPLSRALELLSREEAHPGARQAWRRLHDLVVDGWPLADAMAHQGRVFNKVYVAMVRAGEHGGFLEVVLEQIADFQAREKELRGRMIAAMVYPAVLLALALGVLVFLLVFFIPRFRTIFEGFDASLPAITEFIVGASEITRRHGLLFAVMLAGGGIAFRQWMLSAEGRRAWDRVMTRAPLLGPLQSRFSMARFTRMLGTLLESGVPLVSALRVAKEAIVSQTLTDLLDAAAERVQRGDSLSQSLRDCPELFPPSTIEMISVGEETGRLGPELQRIAETAETELDGRLRMAVSLAEPLILFLIAAFVGVIFIGMVIPIFSLQEQIA